MLRYPGNPILTARHVNAVWTAPDLQVVTCHNAGVAVVGAETVMLFRSHLRSRRQRARPGPQRRRRHRLAGRPAPFSTGHRATRSPGLDPAAIIDAEAGGVEDARINPIDGTFAITYSAYAAEVRNRVRVMLAVTDDFRAVTRHGPVLERDMRNVVLFPERIDGRYVGLFRPNDELPGDTGGIFREIRIGYADDFRAGPWHVRDDPVMRVNGSPSAFADKIGPGAPPVKTAHGWLDLFHGVRTTMDGNPYVLGVALHDLGSPGDRFGCRAFRCCFPTRADCRVRDDDYVHVPNVVFPAPCCAARTAPCSSTTAATTPS